MNLYAQIFGQDNLGVLPNRNVALSMVFKNRKNMIGVLYYFFWNPNSLNEIKKVRINHLGKIVAVGEY